MLCVVVQSGVMCSAAQSCGVYFTGLVQLLAAFSLLSLLPSANRCGAKENTGAVRYF